MSLNSIAYIIYLGITFFITIRVGWICYKNGEPYIYAQLPDKHWVKPLNKLLLTGYYLLNLGFATLTIHNWVTITTPGQLFLLLVHKIGLIMVILGSMHYLNIYVINKIKFLNHKHLNHGNNS